MPFTHPAPQIRRDSWISLNGAWDFALETERLTTVPSQVRWTRQIQVPFAPESSASGIGYQGYIRACWYRRTVELPARVPGHRVLLHFGAVDYAARVWVNGQFAGKHEGGYTPFTLDITNQTLDGASQEIIVHAETTPPI